MVYFYADNGLVALKQPERLQRVFDVLTGLFDPVILKANMRKTVSMDCHPFHAPVKMWVEAYERPTMVTWLTFQERQKRWVQCLQFGIEFIAGSLLTYRQSQIGVGSGDQGRSPCHPDGGAQTYRKSFPKSLLRFRCPVEGCLGGASNWTNLRVHFTHCYVRDTIVILEKGN